MAVIRWGSETKITEVDWLWKPLIPFGKVTLIEGDGGDGKTTLILTIAAMLSRGTPPPALREGRLVPADPIDPVTTFYLTNEDEISDSSLKRFLRAGGDASRFAYSGEMAYHVTMKEDDLREILSETSARLLIIDPFQAFLPEGVSLTSVSSMRPVFTMLANVAKSTGAAIVLVGHLNKNEYSKDIHRGFGTADIAASVRSILLVETDKHRNHFIRAVKSNFDESDFTRVRLDFDENRRLMFRDTGGTEGLTAGSLTEGTEGLSGDTGGTEGRTAGTDPTVHLKEYRVDYPLGTPEEPSPRYPRQIAEVIIRLLLRDGPQPVSEIHRYTSQQGISDKTVQRARARIGAEQIFLNGVAYWQLPDAG